MRFRHLIMSLLGVVLLPIAAVAATTDCSSSIAGGGAPFTCAATDNWTTAGGPDAGVITPVVLDFNQPLNPQLLGLAATRRRMAQAPDRAPETHGNRASDVP